MSITVEKNGRFIISNNLFKRVMQVDEYGLRTVSVINSVTGREYVKRPDAAEFQAVLNGYLVSSYHKPEYHILDGNMTTADYQYHFTGHNIIAGSAGSEILQLNFAINELGLTVKVCYEIYPDIAGCTKWLEFNCCRGELHIKQLFWEMLNSWPGELVDCDFYLRQGSERTQPMFATSDEDTVQLHNSKLREGFYFGNSAPGPLRHFMAYPNWPSGIACGYNMSGADFNLYLNEGETFVSDRALLMLYAGEQDDQSVRNQFRAMIRRELPPLVDSSEPMYCTWLPFLKNINAELILELAEQAARLGFGCFVIDDGWFTDTAWQVDKEKFPDGLKVVADKIKALGLKFGLWYNIGNDYGNQGSRPEDNALDYHGEVKRFGFAGSYRTRCLASGQRDFLVDKLSELADEYGVDYFKLDFSSICSPYGMMPYGCHSTEHTYHRDYSDSNIAQYRSMKYIRERLKARYPALNIDFSFETFGTGTPSIGALQFSELHHVTNLNTLQPQISNARQIRNTLYNFSNLLPVERILGSLICIEGEAGLENYLTSFIGAPLAAGDLRRLNDRDVTAIAAVAAVWRNLNQTAPLTEFYRLRGSRYITASDWDGFARFNRNGHGMLFIFRNSYSGSLKLQLPFARNSLSFRDSNADMLGTYSPEQLQVGIEVDWLKESSCYAVAFSPV